MERFQATVVALVLAALVLFGLGYVVDGRVNSAAPRGELRGAAPESDGGAGRRVALWGNRRESRLAPGGPQGDEPPAEQRRRRRAAASGGAAELIPGLPRRGGSYDGPRGEIDIPGGLAGGEITGEIVTARGGALPRGGGTGHDGGAVGDPGLPFEFVDDPPDERGAGDVLLSLPLDGDLDADQGDMPTQADGLVVDGDAVEFTEDARLTFPVGGHVNGGMGTVSFELEPRWAGSDETNNSLLQIREEHQWENALAIVKNLDSLRFIIRDALGVESNVNIFIDDWQPNVRQRVTATWTAETMAMYVNGELVGQSAGPSGLAFAASTLIHVGSDYPGSTFRGAGANIRNVTVYGRALGADEVR